MPERHLFVSYNRGDYKEVLPVVDAVRNELRYRAIPVDLWMDLSSLQPGEVWDHAIVDALRSSIGFIFFLSARSLDSRWLRRELEVAASAGDRLIIPVVMERPLDIPAALVSREWVDLSGRKNKSNIYKAAAKIAEAAQAYLTATPQPPPAVLSAEAPILAADLATELRASSRPSVAQGPQKSVFVVHGHDAAALKKLETCLSSMGIVAIVLSRQDASPQSLFQKFMSVATEARFAIVLLCADDYGASRKQYEARDVAEKALQFRARQNVIMELGFFYGKLGWESVFVLYQEPARVFPNFERPSDLDGVVFDSFSDLGWQNKLRAKLKAAGFDVRASRAAGPKPHRTNS